MTVLLCEVSNMESFIYAECHKKSFMLNVIRLSDAMLIVVWPLSDRKISRHIPICHHTYQGAKVRTATVSGVPCK